MENEVLCSIPARLQFSLPSFRSAMPNIFAAVEALPMQDESRKDEIAHVACIARIFTLALDEIELVFPGDDQAPTALWTFCAKALLGIDFSDHPYHRCFVDPNKWLDDLSPSGESEHIRGLANYVFSVYECICEHAPQELFGSKGLDMTLFVHAWLCLLTREFGGPHGSTLVPLVDYFNHSTDAGAEQVWDDDAEAVVVKAIRPHKPGEAICIEYGRMSNALLFRTYGFTLPVEQELSCTCTFLENELQAICETDGAFSNPAFAVHLATLPNLHIDSGEVTEVLTLFIKACSKYGVSVNSLLRGVCSNRSRLYRRTERFQQSYRRMWSTSSASTSDNSTDEYARDDVLRVHLSELFCLELHLEALDCVAGKADENQCHPRAAGLREDLRVLQRAGLWS